MLTGEEPLIFPERSRQKLQVRSKSKPIMLRHTAVPDLFTSNRLAPGQVVTPVGQGLPTLLEFSVFLRLSHTIADTEIARFVSGPALFPSGTRRRCSRSHYTWL